MATTRIFCSRSRAAHQIASISADTGGLLLTYRSAVLTTPADPDAVRSPQDDQVYRLHGAQCEQRVPADEVVEIDLWCSGCKTGHPVDAGALFDAARRGQRKVTLSSRGQWDGLWSN